MTNPQARVSPWDALCAPSVPWRCLRRGINH